MIYYVSAIGTCKVIKTEGQIVATKVSFVGILVRDIEEAAKIYTEVLGLEPWEQGIIELPGARALLLQAGECYIELLQPTVGPEAPIGGDLARRLEKYGEGFCRLGLWVDELEAEIKRLGEIGLPVIDPGEYGGATEEMGARMAFIHPKATHGVLIELDQQAP
ncbi:MAG: VOC family protein [Dehalococcoidia bacterium]|nr:MAG: VOC family protein [Dehalococcoidia bacterium]